MSEPTGGTMTPPKLAIHDKAAVPALAHLVCDLCGKRYPVTRADAGHYLQQGWPECCGWTMRLVTEGEVGRGEG